MNFRFTFKALFRLLTVVVFVTTAGCANVHFKMTKGDWVREFSEAAQYSITRATLAKRIQAIRNTLLVRSGSINITMN